MMIEGILRKVAEDFDLTYKETANKEQTHFTVLIKNRENKILAQRSYQLPSGVPKKGEVRAVERSCRKEVLVVLLRNGLVWLKDRSQKDLEKKSKEGVTWIDVQKVLFKHARNGGDYVPDYCFRPASEDILELFTEEDEEP